MDTLLHCKPRLEKKGINILALPKYNALSHRRKNKIKITPLSQWERGWG
jgi:hypothetical protein